MHQKFLKLISFMLVVSLLLSVVTTSNFPSLIVSAEESISEDNRTEEESKEDAVLLTSITGDWNRAKRDGIVPPYGQFHHDVQDHIIDKLKNQGSSLAKKADTTFKVLSAVDDISSIIQYNYNLKQLDCCRFILEDLQSCGFSEIEDAASALLRDMNNSFDATAYATVDKLVDFGTDYLIDKVTDTIASWGTGGLIGTVVLAVGGIVFGESLGADLENSISSNLSKSISEAGLDILYENTKHIKSSSGVYNRVANYTWNCNPIKMYLPSIISARKYSEQKYIDIITEKNWFIDKGAFVYKTSTSESDAKNNISHLNDVLYKYCA